MSFTNCISSYYLQTRCLGLASANALVSYITGQSIVVDGGLIHGQA